MSKNIEMNYFNGSGYEALYPQTNLANVFDYSNYLYSKTEVDSKVSILANQINSVNSSLDNRVSNVESELDNIDSTIESQISNLNTFSRVSFDVNCSQGSSIYGYINLSKKVVDCSLIVLDFSKLTALGRDNAYVELFEMDISSPDSISRNKFLIYNILYYPGSSYAYTSFSNGASNPEFYRSISISDNDTSVRYDIDVSSAYSGDMRGTVYVYYK